MDDNGIYSFTADFLKFDCEAPPDSNIRATRSDAFRLDDLANLEASLRSIGQIIPVVAKRWDDKLYVVSGNRRLAALRIISPDHPVKTVIMPADAAESQTAAIEIALADNEIRCPMHPVDRCEAFGALADRGMTEADIASRFGYAPIVIRRALALRAVAPEILAAWRSGEVEERTARAFTIDPDQGRQAKAFKALKKDKSFAPWAVRRALVGEGEQCAALLKIAGAESYTLAGGTVMTDLFEGNHAVSDRVLLKSLVDDRIADVCSVLASTGWGFAISDTANNRWRWTHVPKEPKFTKDEKAKLKELRKSETDGGDLTVDQTAEIVAIEDVAAARPYSADERKGLGCLVFVEGAAIRVRPGFKMPKAEKASDAPKTPAAKKKAEAKKIADAEAGVVSAALDRDVAKWRFDAVRLALETMTAQADSFFDGTGADVLPAPIIAATCTVLSKFLSHVTDEWLAEIMAVLPADIVNQSCSTTFERENYFGRVSKIASIAAVREILGDQMADKLADKPKAEAARVAAEMSDWLPVAMRTPHYRAEGGSAPTKPSRKRTSK